MTKGIEVILSVAPKKKQEVSGPQQAWQATWTKNRA